MIERTNAIRHAIATEPSTPGALPDAAPRLLPPPSLASLASSGDPAAMIVAMLVDSAERRGEAARARKADALVRERLADDARLDARETALQTRFAGAITSAGAKVFSGVATMAAAATPRSAWNGLAKSSDAVPTGAEGISALLAGKAEDEAARAERLVRAATRDVETASDDVKSAGELGRRVMDLFKEYRASKSASEGALLFRA